ncbi:MAG: hypothetical protein FWE16_00175 [Firmicutes bacterium]|nr:hypothetical protein [Bacillota bacterium]
MDAIEKAAPKYAMYADGDVARLAKLVEAYMVNMGSYGIHKTLRATLDKRFFSAAQMEYLRKHKEFINAHFPGVRPRQYGTQ